MSPKVLNLILKALDAGGETAFGTEDIAGWPKGDFDKAMRIGLLEQAAPATEVVCPGCEDACLEDVEFEPGHTPADMRAYVVCHRRDDIGRVKIPLAALARWAVNKHVAQSVRPSVGAGAGGQLQEASVALADFMVQHCRDTAYDRAKQLAAALLKEARRKTHKIKLPATTNKAKGTQKKLFRPSDLRSRWSDYQMVIPNLPALK